MAGVDAPTNATFDLEEEDGADALVADFIVSALDQVDGTQTYEEDAARFHRQQQVQQYHVSAVHARLREREAS
jgi:hypothetical protein